MTDLNNNEILSVATAHDGAIIVTGDLDIAAGPILQAALLRRGGDAR